MGGTSNFFLIFFVVLQMEQDPTNLYFSNLPKDFDERVSYLTKHYPALWFFVCLFFSFAATRLLVSGEYYRTVGDFVVS